MKLNSIFKWGMIALLVLSVAILVAGFIIGFETDGGKAVDVLLGWGYGMVAIAAASIIIVGLVVRVMNDPKSLVKLGIGIAILAVLTLVSYLLAKGNPAIGTFAKAPTATTLKLTDTLLTLTYIAGAGAILAIIAGEIRMAISNKK